MPIGITALIPPELIYSKGKIPQDINNIVPTLAQYPKNKLCAWTALWRDAVIKRELDIDKLIVVAGGDCLNAVVDGERIEKSGIETFYFFYPFNGSTKLLKDELLRLSDFLDNKKEINPPKDTEIH